MLIKSRETGYIKDVDALIIGNLVRDLGGGRINKGDSIDYAAGFKLIKDEGDFVNEGDVIAEVYFNNMINDIETRALSVFTFSKKKVKPRETVLRIL